MDLRFPLTVYYAFKQDDEDSGSESEENVDATVDLTTGWETLLAALITSGFQITATWPVRASQKWRMVSMGTNALASYIVLACRPRLAEAQQTDRRTFVAALKRELPTAIKHLQQGNIAPVDFAQAAIGPGMAIYSKYTRILEGSGNPMTVRTALSLINQTLTEVLSEQEDEFDTDTRWAIAWFEQHGFDEGNFGDAELLSKAKVTSVAGLQHAGIIHSKAGKVHLLRPSELSPSWDPATDMRDAVPPSLRIAAGLLLAVLLSVVGCHVLRWRNPASPEALLKRADEMSWLNSWIAAEPLYRQAESQFTQRHQLSKALYARVSEMPAHSESATNVPVQIALLRSDLTLPEAHDPETRLRILTILGMLEVNYDSGMARETWTQVEDLALRQHHYLLASRAIGEQGIAAFLLGDMATAKKDVVKAWMVAKTADPGAHIRYASMYCTGLVELHKYNEALGPLNEAIKVAKDTPGAAYPTIAITAKIGSLSGLGKARKH